jgi:hypothetical protein
VDPHHWSLWPADPSSSHAHDFLITPHAYIFQFSHASPPLYLSIKTQFPTSSQWHSHSVVAVNKMVPPLRLASLLLVLLLCTAGANSSSSSSSTPLTKIGNGYRLISIGEIPDGGLVGHLVVNKQNNIYGPDLPHLQLFVKYLLDSLLQVKLHYSTPSE